MLEKQTAEGSKMSDSDTEALSIVLDNGSHKIKAGFSGDDSPRSVFPTIVGSQTSVDDQLQYFIGDSAVSRLSTLKMSRPIEDGVVNNWDDMERVWRHLFNHELRIQPENQPLFVTETPLNPIANREKMAEVLFETFDVPACAVMSSALPVLCANGRTCGLVVDSGHDVTSITPLHDCHVIQDGVRRMNLAGFHVTTYLGNLLNQRGYTFLSTAEKWALDEMKRSVCYIRPDPYDVTSLPTCTARDYQMSHGGSVTVTKERYMAPECIFQPSLVGNQCPGLAQLLNESIQNCDESVRKDLYGNILLAGSSTMFPGFAERLKMEITLLAPDDTVVKVIAPPERRSSVWIGGSILTGISLGHTMWVTRHQYRESGPVVIHTDWEPPPGLGDL